MRCVRKLTKTLEIIRVTKVFPALTRPVLCRASKCRGKGVEYGASKGIDEKHKVAGNSQQQRDTSPLIYGCMGLGGGWNQEPISRKHITQAHTLIETAMELGISRFDHADIYTLGKAERVFGEVLKQNPGLRDRLKIQTKCGIRFADEYGPKRYDLSSQWISRSVEASLRRLGVERLDTLLLHRPDPLMAPHELAETLMTLYKAGKIAAVGVSNMHQQQIKRLQRVLDLPIVANQLEMSLGHLDWLNEGVGVGNEQGRNLTVVPGTLEHCEDSGIELQCWGSLARGRFTGGRGNGETDMAVANLVATLAAEYGVPPEAMVLAWLRRLPYQVVPVVGTTDVRRLRACARVEEVNLSREHWYALFETARAMELP